MAVTQLRCEPRARAVYQNSIVHGDTKKEAMRVLKRHLSNVVYRRMMADLGWRPALEDALLTELALKQALRADPGRPAASGNKGGL
jgi:hypothetical protein